MRRSVLATAAAIVDRARLSRRQPTRASGRRRKSTDRRGSFQAGCERDRDYFIGLETHECSFNVYVRPKKDGDPAHHYVGDWVQAWAKPLKGRCLTGAHGFIEPEDAHVIDTAPRRLRAGHRRPTELSFESIDGRPLGGLGWNEPLAAGRADHERHQAQLGGQVQVEAASEHRPEGDVRLRRGEQDPEDAT